MTRRHRLVNWLRRLKFRLAKGSWLEQACVPFVETVEFALSHGVSEVLRRAASRMSSGSWRLPDPPGTAPDAEPLDTTQQDAVRPRAPAEGVKLIAFYLPQFHPIPENDHAWGKGFTEWTNVTRAKPLFVGHYQPHLPSDLGFYDLRVPETRDAQAELARTHGIHGFCYYYYWFDRLRLLSRPLDEVLATGRPDFPFCICWANEPWSRRWDGSDHEIIAAQEYREGYASRFIEDVLPILKDRRYLRIDGRPVLIVYRLDHVPDAAAAVAVWREACRREGLGEIWLAAMATAGTTDPRPWGFDVSIEFPPHNLTVVPGIEHTLTGLPKTFSGRVFDYAECVAAESSRRPGYPQWRGLMTSWDNTARRGDAALLFHDATPAKYERWLKALLALAGEASRPLPPLIFINAWNEWAEGAHLEPDQKDGRGYLEATAAAVLESRYPTLFSTGVPRAEGAEIGIVIPVHGHVAVTLACLDSLAAHRSERCFEVIVVDDASSDATARVVSAIPNLRYVRSAENRGFVHSCNTGAAASTAEHLVFLNNDTVVHPGWLDELRRTFDAWPGAGLVGSKLIWPDGRMQECGSIIYRDGSAANYGRGDDPDDPRYCFTRECDYVSGAAIMIPRRLFTELGGFDDHYAPGYYEDVDLAFKVRQAGLKVVVNPAAMVTHVEGASAGTDLTSGAKRYQVINHGKFRERWASALERQPQRSPTPEVNLCDRRVLVIDWVVPRPDRDAGSVRMLAMLEILRGLGLQVTFVARDGSYDPRYGAALERLGVEVLRRPHLDTVGRYLESFGNTFGHVIVSRRDVATLHMAAVKKLCPNARVIFDTVDLHFVRESRGRGIDAAAVDDHEAGQVQELAAVRAADVTLVVSQAERDVLTGMLGDIDVRVVSTIHRRQETPRPFSTRAGILFVGYFAHTPNVDAARWLVREILPLLRIDDTAFRVHLVGSDPPAEIRALASERVIVHGYVPDIEALFDACRLSVAPLRYGAGVKGKVGQSLALGVPCVTTSIGAEGIGLRHGVSAMVADTPADFSAAIARVYADEALWTSLRAAGAAVIDEQLSEAAARRALEQLFASPQPDVSSAMSA